MTALPASLVTTRRRPLSSFEFWPDWLFYLPVVGFWILLGIRYRSFSLPTAANPRIETGGLCGERKSTTLNAAGLEAAPWIARYILFRTGAADTRRATAALARAEIRLPLVVKPDIGCNGTGVRLVETSEALDAALASFPREVDLLLQELVPYEGEAGIFYVRRPGDALGRITSLTLKRAPILFGDGHSTIRQLIMEDERSRHIPQLYLPRLAGKADHVLGLDEPFRLVFAGNHCKGSIFSNGNSDITSTLSKQVDVIMRDIPDFHFGRIDIRFETRAALRAGTRFRIIEINGVGSEATHIWDPTTSLKHAYLDQFWHYRTAFEIGNQNRRSGKKPASLLEMYRYWRLQKRLMASYPLND